MGALHFDVLGEKKSVKHKCCKLFTKMKENQTFKQKHLLITAVSVSIVN